VLQDVELERFVVAGVAILLDELLVYRADLLDER
jgi:hypothetical protein